eukprot:7347186-Prorocentrum_lima.AAC.1
MLLFRLASPSQRRLQEERSRPCHRARCMTPSSCSVYDSVTIERCSVESTCLEDGDSSLCVAEVGT